MRFLSEKAKRKFDRTHPPQSQRKLKRRLCGEQNWRCPYCGTGLEIDTAVISHVIPLVLGGQHSWYNAVAACETCEDHHSRIVMKKAKFHDFAAAKAAAVAISSFEEER